MKEGCRCGRPGVIELRYCGEFLCGNCFSRLLEERVKKTIRMNRLLSSDDRIGVALSGGKDSAVTLYLLNRLVEERPKSSIVGLSIDQGIPGFGDMGLDAAKKLCKALGVKHHVYSFRKEYGSGLGEVLEKAERKGVSAPPCSICGVLRRKLLNRKAKDLDLTKIATGHNMDDEIQSSLMNFIRGDYGRFPRMGAKVGVVKDESFVQRIKPLRDCPEEEIKAYADIKKLIYEKKRCPYSKKAFRGSVKDFLNKIESDYPGSKFQLLRSTDHLLTILRDLPNKEMDHCVSCNEPCAGETCNFCTLCANIGLKF